MIGSCVEDEAPGGSERRGQSIGAVPAKPSPSASRGSARRPTVPPLCRRRAVVLTSSRARGGGGHHHHPRASTTSVSRAPSASKRDGGLRGPPPSSQSSKASRARSPPRGRPLPPRPRPLPSRRWRRRRPWRGDLAPRFTDGTRSPRAHGRRNGRALSGGGSWPGLPRSSGAGRLGNVATRPPSLPVKQALRAPAGGVVADPQRPPVRDCGRFGVKVGARGAQGSPRRRCRLRAGPWGGRGGRYGARGASGPLRVELASRLQMKRLPTSADPLMLR